MEEQAFPIKTQIGDFHSEEDIEIWMLDQDDSQVLAVDYMTFIRHSPPIYTEEIGEYLMRYRMLNQHKIYSYGNVFDDLPAKWVDVLTIMESEIPKAEKAKNGN